VIEMLQVFYRIICSLLSILSFPFQVCSQFRRIGFLFLILLFHSACFGIGGGGSTGIPAEARFVKDVSDLVGGDGAQALPGDIVMENERVRFIVQGLRNQPEMRDAGTVRGECY
jgi:hypothetical protein